MIVSIINLIFVFSIICIAIGLTKGEQLANPPKETIKYIPRSLEEELKEPVKAEKIFKSMFEQQVPWIGSFNDTNVFERRELDKKRDTFGK
jgi:hypothetical protein